MYQDYFEAITDTSDDISALVDILIETPSHDKFVRNVARVAYGTTGAGVGGAVGAGVGAYKAHKKGKSKFKGALKGGAIGAGIGSAAGIAAGGPLANHGMENSKKNDPERYRDSVEKHKKMQASNKELADELKKKWADRKKK